MSSTLGEVTVLLRALENGDREALDQVWGLLYDELQSLARRQRHHSGGTLNTTALVHETYLKLVGQERIEVADRAHFFALVVRVMRQLVVDLARRHGAQKRGGGAIRLSLDRVEIPVEEQAHLVVSLDQALDRLARLNGRWAKVVECRFFGGLSEKETAEALELTLRTVQRDWMKGRAWLRAELEGT